MKIEVFIGRINVRLDRVVTFFRYAVYIRRTYNLLEHSMTLNVRVCKLFINFYVEFAQQGKYIKNMLMGCREVNESAKFN